MITVESYGSTSMLGEIWYAEADTPLGPWVYARKVATHDKYSFYNPKQHPMFDKERGRIILFEGTYTTTFSGNQDPTPRYDYNQVMYQLDLVGPSTGTSRRDLPVARRQPEPPLALNPRPRTERTRSPAVAEWPSLPRIARGSPRCRSMRNTNAKTGQTLRVGTGGQSTDPAGAAASLFRASRRHERLHVGNHAAV